MASVSINLDGATFELEVGDHAVEDFKRRFKAMEDRSAAETARADSAESARDEHKEKLDAATAELEEVKSPKHIQDRIKARVDLEARAKRVLGDDARLDEKDDKAVMLEVLDKAEPDQKFDGHTEEALRGVFNFVTDKATDEDSDKGGDRHDGGRGDARRAARTNGKPAEDPVEKARQDARERSQKAYTRPLAVSKDQPAA